VRTFITVVAGVGKMERRHFFVWSGVGAVLWATGVTLAGYFLGQAFPVLQDHLEAAILAIVAVSVVPMVLEFLKHRREAARARLDA
jgi:membrane-associated protein